jgi:acetyl-CoA carboxylase carboxyl transferase subunit beta
MGVGQRLCEGPDEEGVCAIVKEASRPITASTSEDGGKAGLPNNVAVKCPKCRELLYTRDWEKNLKVCQRCGYHFHLSAPERIALLLDPDSFVEADTQLRPVDPLHFVSRSQSYTDKLAEEQKHTGLSEAVVIGSGTIEGYPLALAVMDFRFIGGSMGSVVGEKVTRAIELALARQIPLLIVTASGGARMHEGIFSLLQMAKTAAALTRLSAARLPYIVLLTDPTTGGVTASFAMLGDIILAEPGALIGFAGPRVIEGFMHQKLPADTDTSEFALAHGMIDAIVHRRLLRSTLTRLLRLYEARSCIRGGLSSNAL